MKAKDLMIGDWVMHSTPTGPEPDKIDYFDGRIIVFKYNHRQYEADPVSLTEEILKANFIKSGDNIFRGNRIKIMFHGVGNITYEIRSFDKATVIVDYYCKYVHQLQHALRLCGLNDLADNFKI